jgi:diadenosine tetraphosphate (Ap4A) HIT family hydrolase/HKD family nuclease
MRPDATSSFPSPFSAIPEAEWLCANELAFAIFDSFPVSPGHVLVITRRVVPTYFDCTAAEQAAVMELVGEVKKLLDERLEPKPDGYNVGFNAGAAAGQTVPHVHVHVIPRYAGDMPDPRGGVRHVIPEKGNYLAGLGHPHPSPLPEGEGVTEAHPTRRDTVSSPLPRGEGVTEAHPTRRDTVSSPLPLGEAGRRPGEGALAALSLTTGPDRPLWPRLAERLPGASEIDLLASFVQTSGLDHVREGLFSAIASGAKIRLLVGDYLGITSPDALTTLLGWMDSVGAAFEARLVELEKLRGRPDSFHPKAWRIADSSGGIVVVGSSNLSRAALESGVEWNLLVESATPSCLEARGASRGNEAATPIDVELKAAFDDLWQQATPLSAAVVERYAAWVREKGDSHHLPVAAGDTAPAEGRGLETNGDCHLFPPRPWQVAALASLAAIRGQG